MKRSKIFLAAGSVCLAIVGIAATKAHRTGSSYRAVVTYTTGRACVLGTISPGCDNAGVLACYTDFNYTISGRQYTASGTAIYTKVRSGNCVTHLKTIAE